MSADGHSWATASIAPDYVQKLWPNEYAGRRKHYDFEGQEPANSPPAGYIWTNALAAGTDRAQLRLLGHQQEESRGARTGCRSRACRIRRCERSRTCDTAASIWIIRMSNGRERFLDDVKQFEASGNMPSLMILRLGNDHTNGTTAGRLAPTSLFADNDYALGLIVEGVSKSRFWPKTAIFVIEDDAQNGPDHVDSHRSPMLAISPYTRRGVIDSTMYNQSSVLRTMELILGMRPMTHFDAAAHVR